MYIELVVGGFTNRGKFVKKGELKKEVRKYIRQRIPAYRSFYLYEKSVISPKNYMGNYATDYIVLDIDDHSKLKSVIEKLDVLLEDKYIPFFSGRGFHILFHSDMFGFEPSPNLPAVVKATVKSLFPEVDASIYSKSAIYRLAHTVNQKTGLYKIPLYRNELDDLEYIKELAKSPRLDFNYSEYDLIGDGRLKEYIHYSTPKENIREAFEPIKIATCIHNIHNSGPIKGKRHQSLLVLASHFRRHGIPYEATYNALKAWLSKNSEGFPEEEFKEIVSKVYNVGYTYSCNHPLLKEHCSPQCIYFRNKSYGNEILSAVEMHTALKNRVKEDFTNRTLDLDLLLDVSAGAKAYPGELVTLFGLPGSGKTALSQNIAVGMDIHGNIRTQLPTLYISMEMSAEMMYRRWAQIVMDMTRGEAIEYFKNISDGQPLQELGNILLRVISPSLQQIEEEVKKYQARLVIIDYIELLDVNANSERGRIKAITRFLKQLALREDIIVLAISQVSRAYSRLGVLDLYAGKESSSIEADSDKVIGMWGSNAQRVKKIEFFKNRDSENLDIQFVELTDSFRFRKSTKEVYEKYERK